MKIRKLSTLYKIVLNHITEDQEYPIFICNIIYRFFERNKISLKECDILLLHFNSQRKIACKEFGAGEKFAWWDVDDKKSRIKFLEYLIEETKKQKI